MAQKVRILVVEQRTSLRRSLVRGVRGLSEVEWVLGLPAADVAGALARRSAADLLLVGQMGGVDTDAAIRGLMGARPGLQLVRLVSPSAPLLRPELLMDDWASECVPEPDADGVTDAWLHRQLRPLLHRVLESWGPLAPGRPTPLPAWPEVMLLGASTGGPAAVRRFLRLLEPAQCPPVVLVQHMAQSPQLVLMPLCSGHIRPVWRAFSVAMTLACRFIGVVNLASENLM